MSPELTLLEDAQEWRVPLGHALGLFRRADPSASEPELRARTGRLVLGLVQVGHLAAFRGERHEQLAEWELRAALLDPTAWERSSAAGGLTLETTGPGFRCLERGPGP